MTALLLCQSDRSMLELAARPHDRLQLTEAELGLSLEDTAALPWVAERVAVIRRTRVGLEIAIGSYVGRLVVPDRVVIEVEEPFPGTLRACLALTTGRRRAGRQRVAPSTLAVRPWGSVLSDYAEELRRYVGGGVHKRYVPQRRSTARPRGRIDVQHTIAHVWPRGRRDLLTCNVRVLTDDTDLNRVLLAAAVKAEALAVQLGVTQPLTALRASTAALSGARLEPAPSIREARREVDTGSPEFDTLLGYAEIILSGIPALPPPRLEDASLPVNAWLNPEAIFEEAVRTVVVQAAPQDSVRAGSDDAVALLTASPDEPAAASHKATPDVVVEAGGRILVLDAKYRRHGDDYAEEELYQLMAHARAYGAHAAALVTPAVRRAPGVWAIGRDTADTAYSIVAVDPTSEMSLEEHVTGWTKNQLAARPRSG